MSAIRDLRRPLGLTSIGAALGARRHPPGVFVSRTDFVPREALIERGRPSR